MEIDKIDIRIDQSSRPPMVAISKNYRPMADLYNVSQREIEKMLYKLCAVILQTLDPPSDESDIENDLPYTILDIAISV